MPDTAKELSELQLDRAKEILGFIPTYLSVGDYNGAVNRAYYACFHAIKALEVLDGYDSKKHSGAISYFRLHYIKTGRLPEELSDVIGLLQTARENSDYNIVISFTAEIAEERAKQAKLFVDVVDRYLHE